MSHKSLEAKLNTSLDDIVKKEADHGGRKTNKTHGDNIHKHQHTNHHGHGGGGFRGGGGRGGPRGRGGGGGGRHHQSYGGHHHHNGRGSFGGGARLTRARPHHPPHFQQNQHGGQFPPQHQYQQHHLPMGGHPNQGYFQGGPPPHQYHQGPPMNGRGRGRGGEGGGFRGRGGGFRGRGGGRAPKLPVEDVAFLSTVVYTDGEGRLAVRLHNTDVVTIHKTNGEMVLTSGGFKTPQTRVVITEVLQALGLQLTVSQDNAGAERWCVTNGRNFMMPFNDGMKIRAQHSGQALTRASIVEQTLLQMQTSVNVRTKDHPTAIRIREQIAGKTAGDGDASALAEAEGTYEEGGGQQEGEGGGEEGYAEEEDVIEEEGEGEISQTDGGYEAGQEGAEYLQYQQEQQQGAEYVQHNAHLHNGEGATGHAPLSHDQSFSAMPQQ
uniref:Uncharacterized protein n=1 Tax=Chromera velia CCMP2878 TaxID=1169474 RepID=A0A0G4FAT2_9ALVE|eukprot:Cvel_15949.t1-p1 / transcript=Cvel_15949.t1 / gene=Cvel_15949 / organism=Chromera_velia_CCMP2878 / gene_product=hypothetical protein / transcript_product=hypothetical protein / location=Cvel_scaffold1206:36806-39883(-) / protein_length=435 / sequence_SO=supercontig / SO=protein_coding / is_pseudo=false